MIEAHNGFCSGRAIVGTMRTEIIIFSPVIVCIATVATSRLLRDGDCSEGGYETFSLACGCKFSLLASSIEINDLWEPSSNKMLPSMLICL